VISAGSAASGFVNAAVPNGRNIPCLLTTVRSSSAHITAQQFTVNLLMCGDLLAARLVAIAQHSTALQLRTAAKPV
jgi:hypothetical protein